MRKDLLKRLGCRKNSSFLGVLKPAISSWLVIFLLLQMIAGVLFYPPIREAEAGGESWLTGWSYRKQLTIDETKVDDNLTNFPVLVKLTAANFGS